MKTWSFRLENKPKEIIENLESELNSIGGFDFNNEKSATFNFRKRILYPWYIAFQNWTIVKGELSENITENNTTVKISFNQHFLIKLIVYTHLILGIGLLIAVIYAANDNSTIYVLGGILLALGIILWIVLQRKFEKDTQKYKSLITEIFKL